MSISPQAGQLVVPKLESKKPPSSFTFLPNSHNAGHVPEAFGAFALISTRP